MDKTMSNRQVMTGSVTKTGRYDPRLRKMVYPQKPSPEASRVHPKQDGSAGDPKK